MIEFAYCVVYPSYKHRIINWEWIFIDNEIDGYKEFSSLGGPHGVIMDVDTVKRIWCDGHDRFPEYMRALKVIITLDLKGYFTPSPKK